jgi:hypothetical protein
MIRIIRLVLVLAHYQAASNKPAQTLLGKGIEISVTQPGKSYTYSLFTHPRTKRTGTQNISKRADGWHIWILNQKYIMEAGKSHHLLSSVSG